MIKAVVLVLLGAVIIAVPVAWMIEEFLWNYEPKERDDGR